MNTNDLFAFQTSLALASRFGHGWARFAECAEGAASIEEAFTSIADAMDASEARARVEGECFRDMYLGQRPRLSHVSESGRLHWTVARDGTAVVKIRRPAGACIVFELARGKEPKFTFPPAAAREPRHIQAGKWIAECLGFEVEYIRSIPVREFHAWRVWFAEEVGNG